MPKKKAITLREKSGKTDSPDYQIFLHGEYYGELYFNLRGYQGQLPTKDGIPMIIGEKPLSKYKSTIRQLNKEFTD